MLETPVIPDESGKTTPVQPPVGFTQADLDRVAAAARKEALEKYNAAQERLIALEAEKKEREDAELTEVERLKKEKDELANKFKTTSDELLEYRKNKEEADKRLVEKVEKEMDGLTDEQKVLVGKLPLEMQLEGITQFKKVVPGPGDWGKDGRTTNPSLESVQQVEAKWGTNSPQFRKAWEEYQHSKGR